MSRKYTNILHEMIEECLISNESVVLMSLQYMSEDDVADMMAINELLEEGE